MRIPWRLLIAGWFLMRRSGERPAADRGTEPYKVNPELPWGPGWGKERPPLLGPTHRRVGIAGSANRRITELANERGRDDPDFTRVMLDLARTESAAMWGRPARPPYEPSAGYGAFQWNQGAWDTAGYGGKVYEVNPEQELSLPISKYGDLWRSVRDRGGNGRDAARMIRVWHRSPRAAKKYRNAAIEGGSYGAAWDALRASATGYDAKSIERTDRDMTRMGYA